MSQPERPIRFGPDRTILGPSRLSGQWASLAVFGFGRRCNVCSGHKRLNERYKSNTTHEALRLERELRFWWHVLGRLSSWALPNLSLSVVLSLAVHTELTNSSSLVSAPSCPNASDLRWTRTSSIELARHVAVLHEWLRTQTNDKEEGGYSRAAVILRSV